MAPRQSTRRQKQAAATRQDILAAARRLFAERGYAATSMAAIAEAADTAVQTIYDSVGPKPAIILALVDHTEAEAGVPEFAWRMREATEPRELVALLVALSRRFMEHSGDVFVAMQSAAASEPDVAEAWEKARRNHGHGAAYAARRLAELGALPPGETVDRAADVLGVMTWGATWQQFTRDHGWSLDACEAWLNAALATLLLDAPG